MKAGYCPGCGGTNVTTQNATVPILSSDTALCFDCNLQWTPDRHTEHLGYQKSIGKVALNVQLKYD